MPSISNSCSARGNTSEQDFPLEFRCSLDSRGSVRDGERFPLLTTT
jgi:hypothetical protein